MLWLERVDGSVLCLGRASRSPLVAETASDGATTLSPRWHSAQLGKKLRLVETTSGIAMEALDHVEGTTHDGG